MWCLLFPLFWWYIFWAFNLVANWGETSRLQLLLISVLGWQHTVSYLVFLSDISCLSLVCTCGINIRIRKDKRHNNDTQWNVQHKHRHKPRQDRWNLKRIYGLLHRRTSQKIFGRGSLLILAKITDLRDQFFCLFTDFSKTCSKIWDNLIKICPTFKI